MLELLPQLLLVLLALLALLALLQEQPQQQLELQVGPQAVQQQAEFNTNVQQTSN